MRSILQALTVFTAGFCLFIAFWLGVFTLVNHFGFDVQTTPQYGFSSGVGPMILAALGYSTLVAGMWHSLNCHQGSCWAIGRHRVNGTPWCNAHHEQARSAVTDSDRLDRLITVQQQNAALLNEYLERRA